LLYKKNTMVLLFCDRNHDTIHEELPYIISLIIFRKLSAWSWGDGEWGNQNQVIKPVIRLFLVRHGETLANRQGHVVGQSHSVHHTCNKKLFIRLTYGIVQPYMDYCSISNPLTIDAKPLCNSLSAN
jgi:hypothetical protein